MPRRRLETFRIPGASWWSPGEEVLARDVTEGDMAWVQDQVNKISASANGQQADVQVLAGRARKLLLVRNIVSWTLVEEDRNGNMLPVPMPPYADDSRTLAARERSINGLAPEDAAYLYEKLNERSTPMTPQEQENFLIPAIDGSAANPSTSLMPS